MNDGFKKEDFELFELDQLITLTFLEKVQQREFGQPDLLFLKCDKSSRFYSSSGNTGSPISVYLYKSSHQFWSSGYEVRVKNWAGINKEMRRSMIGGRRVLPKGSMQVRKHRAFVD